MVECSQGREETEKEKGHKKGGIRLRQKRKRKYEGLEGEIEGGEGEVRQEDHPFPF